MRAVGAEFLHADRRTDGQIYDADNGRFPQFYERVHKDTCLLIKNIWLFYTVCWNKYKKKKYFSWVMNLSYSVMCHS